MGIVDNVVFEPIEIVAENQFFDFEAKYSSEAANYILPAVLDLGVREALKKFAFRAHRALGCRHFSRVDLLLDEKNNIFVLEVNTIPGFTVTSLLPKAARYAGLSFCDFCLKLLRLASENSSSVPIT